MISSGYGVGVEGPCYFSYLHISCFFFFEMFQTFVMKVLKKKDKVEKKSIISFLKARWLLKNSKFFFHFCYYVL